MNESGDKIEKTFAREQLRNTGVIRLREARAWFLATGGCSPFQHSPENLNGDKLWKDIGDRSFLRNRQSGLLLFWWS
ncbi:MAG TPA: hypothetical protein VF599_16590 [Pyrinomonadaceae bacterium]